MIEITSRFKKIVEYLLDSYVIKNSKSVRDYVSNRTDRFGRYEIVMGLDNCTLNQVIGEYKIYDLRKDDIVLDIGANVGGFSMLVCESVKYVYAVEPLFADILKENIKRNHIKNVEVFDVGLGATSSDCSFRSRRKNVECLPLSKLIEMCGGKIDFLKCDCEGGEWSIQPHEINGIRRIEIEVHGFNNENLNDFSDMLINAGYDVDIENDNTSKKTMMIHAVYNRADSV